MRRFSQSANIHVRGHAEYKELLHDASHWMVSRTAIPLFHALVLAILRYPLEYAIGHATSWTITLFHAAVLTIFWAYPCTRASKQTNTEWKLIYHKNIGAKVASAKVAKSLTYFFFPRDRIHQKSTRRHRKNWHRKHHCSSYTNFKCNLQFFCIQ